MKKYMFGLLASLVVIGLFSVSPVVFAEDNSSTDIITESQSLPSFTSQGGSEFEPGTFKTELVVGESGQIRRPQDSPLKDFVYSFDAHVTDSSILSFDEEGHWVAHKAGKTQVVFQFPSGESAQAQKFNQELAHTPVNLLVDDVAVVFDVTVIEANPISSFTMYRLYNPNNKEHFYTNSVNERDTLVRIGWGIYEGPAWQAPATGKMVYRLYNPILKDHHYTTDENEVATLVAKNHWKNEGLAWYSGGERPIYRLFHPHLTSGSHHYTLDENEVKVLQSRGWIYEGIAWYAQ